MVVRIRRFILPLALWCLPAPDAPAQVRDTIFLWPGEVPGQSAPKHLPSGTWDPEGRVMRLTEVTNPALIVFPPDPGRRTDAAVIVCPGGGYNILAIDKEGYEVAEWLNDLGITAFVLQYRVPRRQAGALQDLQRAIALVRSRAREWGIDPGKVGAIGFSAGGSLAARASARSKRTYAAADAHDLHPVRPDFALLIYPAYLDEGKDRSLTPELSVDENTPPMFLFGTADDRHGNSVLVMAGALRDAGVPVELHLLAGGGHGYGLRRGNPAAEAWPELAESWLRNTISGERVRPR